jgi:hypothetical protein
MTTKNGLGEDVIAAVSAFGGPKEPRAVIDALRATISGSAAAHVIAPAVTLFETGGKLLLDEASRRALRAAAERGAERALALAAGPLLGPVSEIARRRAGALDVSRAARAARAVAPLAARAAGKEILKTAGKAAGVGLVIDGAVAGVEAAMALRSGAIDGKQAATYVAKEAATGAIATGAGVVLGAGLVALTGGAAAPVVFAVGALGSIGAKRLLRRVGGGRTGEIRVRAPEPDTI